MVSLPGHTPGHAGMLVGRRVLLAGDAGHTVSEFAAEAPDVAAWCASTGLDVLLSHDPQVLTR